MNQKLNMSQHYDATVKKQMQSYTKVEYKIRETIVPPYSVLVTSHLENCLQFLASDFKKELANWNMS